MTFVETIRVVDGFTVKDSYGNPAAQIRFVAQADQVSGHQFYSNVLEIMVSGALTGIVVTGPTDNGQHADIEVNGTLEVYPF